MAPGPAEDAVQEAFLTVWRSRSCYEPERGSARVAARHLHRRAIDVVRRNAVHTRRETVVEDMEDRWKASERTEPVVRREEASEVHVALGELPSLNARSSSSPTSAASPTVRSPAWSRSRWER